MTNKLSIITINKNNASGLKRTIESVVIQDNKDFELVIVDGASTDESLTEISFYKNALDELGFKLISEVDNGIYQAMNKGIMLSSGDYLLFLNSGDTLNDRNVISKLYSNNFYSDIVCCKCNIIQNNRIVHTTNPPDFVTFGTLFFEGLAHQSTLIKKDCLIKNGMYNESFRYNSDIEFWYKSIINGGASTEHLNLVLSNFYYDGISYKERLTYDYQQEINMILSNEKYSHFLPDYEKWKNNSSKSDIVSWALDKKLIYNLIFIIFKISTFSIKLVKGFVKVKNR